MPSRVPGAWRLLAVLFVLLPGRAALAEPPPTNQGQGTRLHGTGRFEHVNIPLASAILPADCRLTLDKGTLRAERKTPAGSCNLRGTNFKAPFAGRTVEFTIKSIKSHQSILRDNSADVKEYQVDWSIPGESSGSLCSGGSALAVPHAWSTAGELLETGSPPKHFTFACVPRRNTNGEISGGGAIAKCIDWGFPPWPVGKVKQLQREVLQRHQVCVRMATADYCGEGKPNTIDGTRISWSEVSEAQVDNQDHFLQTPVPLSGYYLEAVWGVDDCGRLKILCLGKKRWDTLSLDGTCVDRSAFSHVLMLPGEEFNQAVICENTTRKVLMRQGARLVSYSAFSDKLLVRFDRGEGKAPRFMTTSDVEMTDNAKYVPGANLAPWKSDEATTFEVEGPILGKDIGILNPQLMRLLMPIYKCKLPDGQIITVDEGHLHLCPSPGTSGTSRPGSGVTSGSLPTLANKPGLRLPEEHSSRLYHRIHNLEGYIYGLDGAIKNNPLYLWRTGDGRYATSTRQPAAEYIHHELLGYLPPLSQIAERALELSEASSGGTRTPQSP